MQIAAYLSPEMQRAAGSTLRPGGLTLTDRAMAVCRFAPGAHLLDVGCGPGATLRYLAETHAMQVWGIDRSFEMLLRASRSRQGSRLIQASGMAIPLINACLDGVFCECVLSLMPDPLSALTEYGRILRPGGRLVVSDLYLRHTADTRDVLAANPGSSCLAGARDEATWIEMVRDAGFTIRLWEDHTPFLTQLAADMIFSQGSMDWFWNVMGDGPAIQRAACRSKPGYFLMVAVKGNEIDG